MHDAAMGAPSCLPCFLGSMKLITMHRLGRNRDNARLWLESGRLAAYGFGAKTRFTVETTATGLRLKPSPTGERIVSSRREAGGERPIIDLNSNKLLGYLADFHEVKVQAAHNLIICEPSRRAFSIRSHRSALKDGRIPVLEMFTGAGTVSRAFHQDSRFEIVGAIEIEPRFADAYSTKFPSVPLYQMDARDFDPADSPEAAVIFASLPCTCFSTAGVSKKGLKGRNELGDTGDLFIPLLGVVRHKMPLAVVVENVPAFAGSYAASVLAESLRRIGYHVAETTLNPHSEWNEIQDRRRYVMVATLDAPFEFRAPGIPFSGRAGDFLDPVDDEADRADAGRIANTILGLDAKRVRDEAAGKGFGYTTITRDSEKVPTICRSYHKINTGPFVETAHGLRMLRLHEMERMFGTDAGTAHYATAVEILGQGTQTRVFQRILSDLADHLSAPAAPASPVRERGQLSLGL